MDTDKSRYESFVGLAVLTDCLTIVLLHLNLTFNSQRWQTLDKFKMFSLEHDEQTYLILIFK